MSGSGLQIEEVIACDYTATTLAVVGHVDKRKFRGRLLSGTSSYGSSFDCEPEKEDIFAAEVIQGYRVNADRGEDEYCEYEVVVYYAPSLDELERLVGRERWIDQPEAVTYARMGSE